MVLTHTTVLLNEAVLALLNQEEAAQDSGSRRFVDATFGRGGHTRLLLSQLAPADRLTVFDKDPDAIAVARQLSLIHI